VDTVVYDIEPIGLINAEISVSADIILETLVAPNASVIFLNTSDYDDISKRCEWHFDDETILKSCDELVEHIYTKAGCYNPFLIVMNRDLPECRDTAYLETCVFVDNASKLEIPNIFSPNADGNNDYFQVKAQSLRNFSGIIVNRWGRTIFEWTNWQDYESGWDGKINRKSDASPGVYFYIIQAEGFDGTIFSENGTVTLMRE
jgi:gliding motility-associated-like protein